MHHSQARVAIDGILVGTGFGERAEALINAATLAADPALPPGLGDRLLAGAVALPIDEAGVERASRLTSPLPDTVEDLARECGVLVTDHPADTARQVASLDHLCRLWPHANREERLRLRLNWLASMTSRTAPINSYVTRAQLRQWQRSLPTAHESDAPCASVLAQMLKEERPERAYGILSFYLGANTDLPTLSWTLGVLAEQVLLHHFDPRGWSVHALVGTIACERLSRHVPPETLVTMVSQLSHHIWWCAQESSRRPLEKRSGDHTLTLEDAVMQGDIYAAERAARIAMANREGFWKQVSWCLEQLVDQGHDAWPLAQDAIVAVRYRGGAQVMLSPDDAATIGASLASARYVGLHGNARAERLPG